jgi:DNA-binding LytR/AlgR family response regulator
MITILIVEDNILLAKGLRKSLQKYHCEVVGIAHTGKDAIDMFDRLEPTFVFLDIELDDSIDGVQVAEYINKKCRVPFIFLTSHFGGKDSFFKRAHETKPASYLPKGTFSDDQLWHFVESALLSFARGGDLLIKDEEATLFLRDQFLIKTSGKWEKVRSSDIMYITVNRPYCQFHVVNRLGKYLVRKSLDQVMDLLAILPLIRLQQSHAANAEHIHQYAPTKDEIIMNDGMHLSIGRKYKEDFKRKMPFLD